MSRLQPASPQPWPRRVQIGFGEADKRGVSSESIHAEARDAESSAYEAIPAVDGLRKKDLKRLQDATRPLDSWERYRALVDSSEEAYDLIDTSNREARFALIVMGTLNALPLVFLTRTDAVANLSAGERLSMIVLFSGYAILLLFFILQAIEALHPGWFKPEIREWSDDRTDHPIGVRHFEEIIKRSAAEHWTAWQNVRLSQLNAELAVQVHCLARKNHAKHLAVRRLYLGLRTMALTLAFVLLLYGVFSLV